MDFKHIKALQSEEIHLTLNDPIPCVQVLCSIGKNLTFISTRKLQFQPPNPFWFNV